MSTPGRVLHLCPPNGGGVDRFVRDLCSHRTADWIVHVAAEQYVLEYPSEEKYIPLSSESLTDLAISGCLGRPAILHAHSACAPERHATELLMEILRVPCVISLHDIGFDRGASANEISQRQRFCRRASRLSAPSQFIAALADQTIGGAYPCKIIECGVNEPEWKQAEAKQTPHFNFQVAIIGAIGAHKGLAALLKTLKQLPNKIRAVIFGYTEWKLTQGWLLEDRIWVHGSFEPADLRDLISKYGCQIAFFPEGQPESYCYALSDAWFAHLPVIAPDVGALGERVHRCGGGYLYKSNTSSQVVASMIMQCLGRENKVALSQRAAAQLLSVEAMVTAFNGLYEEIGLSSLDQLPADKKAISELSATHLNSRFFRKELIRLQGDLEAAVQERGRTAAELAKLSQEYEDRGRWIQHLESDVQRLSEQLRVSEKQIQELDHRFLELQSQHQTLKDKLLLPLRPLPPRLRRWLIQAIKRLTNGN